MKIGESTTLFRIINSVIKIHPLALCRFEEVEDKEARNQISEMTRHYKDKTAYFIDPPIRHSNST